MRFGLTRRISAVCGHGCLQLGRRGLSCCGQGFRGSPATLGAHPARGWGDAGPARMEVPVPDLARAMRGATGQGRQSGVAGGRHPADVSQCGSSAFTSRDTETRRAGDLHGGTGPGPGRTTRSSVPLCSRHVVARNWGHPTTSQSKKPAKMKTADRRFVNPSRKPPACCLQNVLPSPCRSICSLAGCHFPLLPGSCRRVQRSQQWPVGLECAGAEAREPPAPLELDPSAKGGASQTVLGAGCSSPAERERREQAAPSGFSRRVR